MNLGLLDPVEVVSAAEEAYMSGMARLSSVEGFIRQIIGWRDFVWHLYWHFGAQYLEMNELGAERPLPTSWRELDGAKTSARCVSNTLEVVQKQAWHHHIPRLMILGNIALQQGYNPKSVNDWFIDNFADGYKWVMPANTIGMSLHADGGLMSTKPYAGGGSYISKMSNHCKACPFDPKARTGDKACPVTNGYWQFLDKHQERFSKNHRMLQALSGLKRLSDRESLSNIDFDSYGF
jgi:deoxyribodipyrimidine photolyase-related protein